MKCIIQYKEQNEQYKCFCGKEKECSKCNIGTNRKSDSECDVEIGGYCTCRTCGFVVKG